MKRVLMLIGIMSFAASTQAEASLYAYVEQVAPYYYAVEGFDSIWEVFVPSYEPEQCAYSWSAHLPNGYEMIFFGQKTWTASAALPEPGEYTIKVNLKCTGSSGVTEFGVATLVVYVADDGVPNYPPPPIYSDIRPTASSSFPPINNPACVVWHSYDYETHRYYRHYNAFCSGGSKQIPLPFEHG